MLFRGVGCPHLVNAFKMLKERKKGKSIEFAQDIMEISLNLSVKWYE
jgi:hypothetical protein